jgi:hypothetical protein
MPELSAPPRRLDAFERAYTAGTVAAPPADDREAEREAREGEARAEPGEPFALKGCVLTPDEALEDGFVVVTGGSIAEVRDRRPRSLRVIDTGGVIMPGLIDLHGHPEYNVFAPWEPPRRYVNRYQWRRSPEYAAVVKQPWARLTYQGLSMAHVAAALRRRHAMAHPWHIRCSTNMFAGIRKRYLICCFGSPPFVQIRHTSVREAQAWGDPGHPRPGHRSRICWKSSSGCRASNSSAGSTTKYP